QAKDRIHKLTVRKIDFRTHAQELAQISAILGRHFDKHAWSLVAATSSGLSQRSPGTNSTGPPAPDRQVEQSRTYCRAVSDAALARILTTHGEPRAPKVAALLDRLADLRGGSYPEKGPMTTTRERDKATAPRLHFVDDAEAVGLRFVF